MSKCKNCGVEINDPVSVCPLCRCILEQEDGERAEAIYPYVYAEKEIKKMQRALGIYLVSAIAAELILCLADYAARGSAGWVILIGIFLAYGYLTLKVSISMQTGYRLIVFIQAVLGVAVLLAIDVVSGFKGWSLTYVIPAACMLIDLAIVVMMLVNIRDWQSYIPFQIVIIAFSVLPFVLYGLGFVRHLTVPVIGLAVSLLVFVGTMIIGGRRAREELARRFHV